MSVPQPSNGSEAYHSLSWAYQTYLRHDEEEQNHWEDVCRSFRQYATFAMTQWAMHQYRLAALPPEQAKVLPAGLQRDTPEFQCRMENYKEAAIRNQFCLDCILRHAGQPHSQGTLTEGAFATDGQMSKVSSVLKSLARDWSSDGRVERDLSYKPIIDALKAKIPWDQSQAQKSHEPPRICVPGAGVGRLTCEIASLGYNVQGNEFSLPMLLASDFILNGPIKAEHSLKISPWLLETRNVHDVHDPLRVVEIPDVDPYSIIVDAHGSTAIPDFSMAAGEFVSIYKNQRESGQWDAVVACFFLDASPSIVEYLQVIYQMLKPGGLLLNFGPLLWHWSGPAMRPDDKSFAEYQERYSYLDRKYLTSIDMSWEDVLQIIVNVGFEIQESTTGNRALYTADRRSMMNIEYRCVHLVARKPTDTTMPDLGISINGEVSHSTAGGSMYRDEVDRVSETPSFEPTDLISEKGINENSEIPMS